MLLLEFAYSWGLYSLKEKLIPVAFSQCVSQVPSDHEDVSSEKISLPTSSFGMRINWYEKNDFHQQSLPVATIICNLKGQMCDSGDKDSSLSLKHAGPSPLCSPRLPLRPFPPKPWCPRTSLYFGPSGHAFCLMTSNLPTCPLTCSLVLLLKATGTFPQLASNCKRNLVKN